LLRVWRGLGLSAGALPLERLEQALVRAGVLVDRRMRISDPVVSRGHGREREIRRIALADLIPGQRCRYARVGSGSHGVRGSDGAILGVLVVVDEHTVALF